MEPSALGPAPVAVNRASELLSRLQAMRSSPDLADVVLVVKPSTEASYARRFPCHRLVLGLWSDVFKSMFECLVPEGHVAGPMEVPLNGDDPKAVELLLDFCYSGRLELNSSNVMGILALADKYTIQSIVKTCGSFLGDQIDIPSVCHILENSQKHGARESEKKCQRFLVDKFYQVCREPTFFHLSGENIKWVLGSDHLVCESELSIFQAVMDWVAYDESRGLYLRDILELVRFTRFSAADLGMVDNHPIATKAGDFYLRRLLDAYKTNASPTCTMGSEAGRQYYKFAITGVMHHLPVAVIEAQGWREVYRQPYAHATLEEDIRSVVAGCSHMLVAARQISSQVLELCAAGRVPHVMKATHGRYDFHEENGAHWYCWSGKAFGFSRGKQVDLFWADVCQFEGGDRLSWVLDGRGGWRVGRTFLYDASEAIHTWEKVIYVRDDDSALSPRATSSTSGSVPASPQHL